MSVRTTAGSDERGIKGLAKDALRASIPVVQEVLSRPAELPTELVSGEYELDFTLALRVTRTESNAPAKADKNNRTGSNGSKGKTSGNMRDSDGKEGGVGQ